MKVRVSVGLISAHRARNNFKLAWKILLFKIVVKGVEISLKLIYHLYLKLYKFAGECDYLLELI